MKSRPAVVLLSIAFILLGCDDKPSESATANPEAVSPPAVEVAQQAQVAPVAPVASLPSPVQQAVTQQTLAAPKDHSWYLMSPDGCVKVSDKYDGVNSPEELVQYAAKNMGAHFEQTTVGSGVVMLKDPEIKNFNVAVIKGKLDCEIYKKLTFDH